MNGLAKQMDGMEIDLNHSKDRVRKFFSYTVSNVTLLNFGDRRN